MTDTKALRRQLEEIRHRGYAMSLAERTAGIRSVAAALFDHDGSVTGCLSVSGPEMRMPTDRMHTIGSQVRRAAWTVSEALGATPAAVGARHPDVGGRVPPPWPTAGR